MMDNQPKTKRIKRGIDLTLNPETIQMLDEIKDKYNQRSKTKAVEYVTKIYYEQYMKNNQK